MLEDLLFAVFLYIFFALSCPLCPLYVASSIDNVYKRVITEKHYEYIESNVVMIEMSFKYRIDDGNPSDDWKNATVRATGLKINKDYILTLRHCTVAPRTMKTITPFGSVVNKFLFTKDSKIINIQNNKEWYLVGTNKDIALLSRYKDVNHQLSLDIQVPIADLDNLKNGNIIYVSGHSMGICRNFKVGVFSNFFNLNDFPNSIAFELEDTHEDILVISMPISKGDSGAPVFVYNKKKDRLEVIGIVGMKIGYDSYGLVYRIDDALDSVNKILTKKD